MTEPKTHSGQHEPSEEGLRQALLRLTRPGTEPLQEEIAALRSQIESLEALRASLEDLRARQSQGDEGLRVQIEQLNRLLQDTRLELTQLDRSLERLEHTLREEIAVQGENASQQLASLHQQVIDPQEVAGRVSPVLIPLLHQRARSDRDEFAEALAPAVGPAIRHQIREAREDIVESLYPVIGQIIGKSISEAIRELTRNIDARLRQQLRLRSRVSRLFARLRGVSEAELLLRQSLPFSIQQVFLIHRQNGLLLEHLSAANEEAQDLDLISGMLTAIQDFVGDSFGREEGELEEITHGDLRFLLERGQYAYLAVVLKGVEPPGYSQLIHQVIHGINLQYEKELREFSGDMGKLPDLKPSLAPLMNPDLQQLEAELVPAPLSRSQKWALGGALAGGLLVMALAAFACIFTVRLWRYAFGSTMVTSTATATSAKLDAPAPSHTAVPTHTSTPLPSPTRSPLPSASPTQAPSNTPLPSPTSTFTPTASTTPATRLGVAQGNLNLRLGPGMNYPVVGALLAGQEVTILQQQGEWLYVSIQLNDQETQYGWVWGKLVLIQ